MICWKAILLYRLSTIYGTSALRNLPSLHESVFHSRTWRIRLIHCPENKCAPVRFKNFTLKICLRKALTTRWSPFSEKPVPSLYPKICFELYSPMLGLTLIRKKVTLQNTHFYNKVTPHSLTVHNFLKEQFGIGLVYLKTR